MQTPKSVPGKLKPPSIAFADGVIFWIKAWRLVASKFADRIFSGAGAYRYGGRWNSPGRAVVYMSEHFSLCALEALVHMVQMPMLQGFKYISMDIPQELITEVEIQDLPADWTVVPAPNSTRRIGDHWFDDGAYPVLRVPSTVHSHRAQLCRQSITSGIRIDCDRRNSRFYLR